GRWTGNDAWHTPHGGCAAGNALLHAAMTVIAALSARNSAGPHPPDARQTQLLAALATARVTRWISRAATRAVTWSRSCGGDSSATSSTLTLPVAAIASSSGSTTSSGTPRALGALTPGAIACGRASRQIVW